MVIVFNPKRFTIITRANSNVCVILALSFKVTLFESSSALVSYGQGTGPVVLGGDPEQERRGREPPEL